MIINNLFESILIAPHVNLNANILFVVSGYASATFTRMHILALKERRRKFLLKLIIGMPGNKSDHLAFLNLHSEFEDCFRGYYLQNSPPVHSKVYSWYQDDRPIAGFAGSANYSQYGFLSPNQLNQISNEDPHLIRQYYERLETLSIYMPNHQLVLPQNHITIPGNPNTTPAGGIIWEIPLRRVRISFLERGGELPQKSGINWGHRKNRERNQAYLSIKGNAAGSGFLPERGDHFSLITDDGVSMDCVVAQDGGKAVESTVNNSILGKYLRDRIGVARGKLVTKEDLERYGRTDFTIEKVDDETYILDLSI